MELKKTFSDAKTLALLHQTEEWLENVMCLDKAAYVVKQLILSSCFDELVQCALLDERVSQLDGVDSDVKSGYSAPTEFVTSNGVHTKHGDALSTV